MGSPDAAQRNPGATQGSQLPISRIARHVSRAPMMEFLAIVVDKDSYNLSKAMRPLGGRRRNFHLALVGILCDMHK
jgi:hypothetical protein